MLRRSRRSSRTGAPPYSIGEENDLAKKYTRRYEVIINAREVSMLFKDGDKTCFELSPDTISVPSPHIVFCSGCQQYQSLTDKERSRKAAQNSGAEHFRCQTPWRVKSEFEMLQEAVNRAAAQVQQASQEHAVQEQQLAAEQSRIEKMRKREETKKNKVAEIRAAKNRSARPLARDYIECCEVKADNETKRAKIVDLQRKLETKTHEFEQRGVETEQQKAKTGYWKGVADVLAAKLIQEKETRE